MFSLDDSLELDVVLIFSSSTKESDILLEVKDINLILRRKISTLKSFDGSININQHHKRKHLKNSNIEFFLYVA